MGKRVGRVHIVIPDCQVRPGVPTEHLRWIGNYVAAKRPDVVVNIGDFADMPSLNSYAVGKAEAEGKRYVDDVQCVRQAMGQLMAPWRKLRSYRPELHFTLGNHEHRIDREAEGNPKLLGAIGVRDLGYEAAGWTVHPFLKVARIDLVDYAHYFVSGSMGRPVSSAAALLRARQSSAVMGHVQRQDLCIHPFTQNVALLSGIAYLHDEPYLGPQSNAACKRGIWMLTECGLGSFDPCFVSLEYLRRNYS